DPLWQGHQPPRGGGGHGGQGESHRQVRRLVQLQGRQDRPGQGQRGQVFGGKYRRGGGDRGPSAGKIPEWRRAPSPGQGERRPGGGIRRLIPAAGPAPWGTTVAVASDRK